jgi:hypothetical protein
MGQISKGQSDGCSARPNLELRLCSTRGIIAAQDGRLRGVGTAKSLYRRRLVAQEGDGFLMDLVDIDELSSQRAPLSIALWWRVPKSAP